MNLPDSLSRLHPVFHVSLLEPRDKDAPMKDKRPEPIEIDDVGEWIVKDILDKKKLYNRDWYLIDWLGYPPEERTWEPLENLTNCKDQLDNFNLRKKVQSRQTRRTLRPRPKRGL